MDLYGAVCLVTGATSGIGRATAVRLAAGGARLVVAGRDPESLDAVALRTGGAPIRADVGDPQEVARIARQALDGAGRIDVLVNNAGEGWAGSFRDMDPDHADRIVQVNLRAPILLTRALLPAMIERGSGHVVNVASIAGHVGVRDEAVYSATKAGLIAFSESLRYELAGTGVGVSVVSPGPVRTAFFERRGRPYERGFPRLIEPEDVAEAVVRAIRDDRAEVFAPRWMAFPSWVRGTWPQAYRFLAKRFG